MKSFIVVLTAVLMIAVAANAGTPYSVPVGSSSLIDNLDYSDTFTVGLNNRNNLNGLDWYAWAGYPEAVSLEDNYGFLAASWSGGWNHPGGASKIWFHDSATILRTGTGNAGADAGVLGIGASEDTRHKYGIARERFVVQLDAVLPEYYDDRLDIGFSAVDYTGGGQADWTGNASQTTFIFIRADGRVHLYSLAVGGDCITNWATGIDTAVDVDEWHNFAILCDVENDSLELFVDEVSKGVLDLSTFHNGDFSGIPTEYIGVGGHNDSSTEVKYSAIDNYQIGSVPGILDFDLSDGSNVVEEGGATDSFTVALSSVPVASVTVTLSDPNNEVTFDPCELTFTTGDWATPQGVDVAAVDDGDTEWNEYAYIRFAAASTDTNFDDTTADVLPVLVIDNDVPGVIISESDDSTDVSEEGPTQDQYTMVLRYPPTASVTINIASDAEQVVVPASLTFTTSDWATPQGVDVTAVDDDVLDADPHITLITHTVVSNDELYDEIAVDDVSVSITENDCGAWGYKAADVNEDCYVNLLDFAQMASDWLVCTMPFEAGCVHN